MLVALSVLSALSSGTTHSCCFLILNLVSRTAFCAVCVLGEQQSVLLGTVATPPPAPTRHEAFKSLFLGGLSAEACFL